MGLEELLRLSLANKEGERFSLLPLTRSFAQAEFELDPELHRAALDRWRSVVIGLWQQLQETASLDLRDLDQLLQIETGVVDQVELARLIVVFAQARQAAGDLVTAQRLFTNALERQELLLGEQHPDTLSTFISLAALLLAQQAYDLALPLLQRALAIQEQLFGAEDRGLVATLMSLGEIDLALQDNGAAEQYLARALAIVEQAGAAPDLDAARILSLQAELREQAGDFAAAWAAYQRALIALDGALAQASFEKFASVQSTLLDRLRAVTPELAHIRARQSRRAHIAAVTRAIGALGEFSVGLDDLPATEHAILAPLAERLTGALTREAARAGRIEILEEVASPYIFTAPVRGAALIGRNDLFQRIVSLWARSGQRNSLLIHGHRRMGKTSLAQALRDRCAFGDDTQLVYLSAEGIDLSHEGYLYSEIADQFWLLRDQDLKEPNVDQFVGASSRTALNRFLARLDRVIRPSRVVLVIDEFEVLYRRLGPQHAADVIAFLRAKTQAYQWMALALVGLSDLDDLRRSYGSPLLGWETIRVSFLDSGQVANVLTDLPNAPDFPLDYTLEALESIATLTNGQPYLVQVIGDLLVQRYNRLVFTERHGHSGVFDIADVHAVLDDPIFYVTAAAYFEGVWGQATGGQPGEVAILVGLSDYKHGLGEARLRVQAQLSDLVFAQSIDALIRHDILARQNQRITYTVPLMRRWVQDTHPRNPPATVDEEAST
jgi:hypothetical protein